MPLHHEIKKVLVIGSGPIVIGQAAEFDYAGTQACLALKEENIEVVLINNNPATIMTDEDIADKVYIEPLTIGVIEDIIQKEKPDGVIGTLGGQTGLNLTVELYNKGILKKYGVKLLGTSVESIQKGEDREQFRSLMIEIGEPVPQSKIIHTYEEGRDFVNEIGYPVIIRPAYTLGGSGGGFATNESELEGVLNQGLKQSPIHQVLIERSIKGWKEIEYEVMRDENDTCTIVCNMENIDPVGVHTGDSIVVAPSQTLSDVQYQILRNASLKIIRALDIVGGCNIQFALNPTSNDYTIIEVNPRVSRSSALASKATGYPIARIAAKCAIGFHLDEIINPITGTTYASFEPALDYVTVKIPRFPFDKFVEADRTLGTQMKATGEVMAIDRTFEGGLNKGLRSLEMGVSGLHLKMIEEETTNQLITHLEEASDLRLFAIAALIRRGMTLAECYNYTKIDMWFLEKIAAIVKLEQQLTETSWDELPPQLCQFAKRLNMSDKRIAELFNIDEKKVREKWKTLGLHPSYKLVDTCAAEFEAQTPYYYSTWWGEDEVEVSTKPKILVIGSGPIRIGQGIEFDYASVQAVFAIKKCGYEAVVINNNPETVSTDYSIADRLYFEPLALEDVMQVINKEKIEGVLIQFGGQTAVNLAEALQAEGVNILGTSIDAIDQLEDRDRFYQLLKKLNIPHIEGKTIWNFKDLNQAAHHLGFPILVRPSYVIGGQSMFIFYNNKELTRYIDNSKEAHDRAWPLLVDRYEPGLECEIDAICDGHDVVIPGIFEHIEKAGVHSGDSIAVFPSVSLNQEMKETVVKVTKQIVEELAISGLMNIQFVVKDGVVKVLEVNPRASRTVPIVTKVTGFQMVETAVKSQLGQSLQQQGYSSGLLAAPPFYSVKAPVFSASKLKHVDHVLGPEMKSTGEQLGLGLSFEEAFNKAVFLSENNPFEHSKEHPFVFLSINERERAESLPIVKVLEDLHFKIIATQGTATYLENQSINVARVVETIDDVKPYFTKNDIAAVINSPTQGRNRETFGFQIRELAVQYQTPTFTCLDTVAAVLKMMEKLGKEQSILTITDYRKSELVNN